MAPLAHLLLAACALAAPLHAASLSPPSEKKITAFIPEEIKEPEIEPGHELADLIEPVKEIQNELRLKPAEGIPVAVVIEDVEPSVKINEVDDGEPERPQVDLQHPGPPQRQEHETQNPEQHSDEQLKASTIKESIEQAQILLKQSFQGVANDIQTWVSNNEDQMKIQQNIQNLRETFRGQIQKLNDTINTLVKPEESKPAELQGQASERDFEKIESRLKILEDNFNNGVNTLSAGVQIVASLKSASEEGNAAREESAAPSPALTPASSAQPSESAPPTTAAPTTSAPTNPLQNMWQGLTSINSNILNFFNSTLSSLTSPNTQPPVNAGQQADQPEGTATSPQSPNWPVLSNWTNPFNQLFNYFNRTELPNPLSSNWSNPISQIFNDNRTALSNPFSANWSNPINQLFNRPSNPNWPNPLGSLANVFSPPRQTTTVPTAISNLPTEEKPAEPNSDKPAAPVAAAALEASPPAAAAPAAASPPASQPEGPIRQFINNSRDRITGAVQQLQNTLTSAPERGRDPVEKNDRLSAKGGWYGRPGNPGGSGDNYDSGLSQQRAEDIKEPIQEEPKKEAEGVKEVKPEVVPEKTE